MAAPCRECRDRGPGCHGRCGAYLAWRVIRSARLKRKAEQEARDYEIKNQGSRRGGPKARQV